MHGSVLREGTKALLTTLPLRTERGTAVLIMDMHMRHTHIHQQPDTRTLAAEKQNPMKIATCCPLKPRLFPHILLPIHTHFPVHVRMLPHIPDMLLSASPMCVSMASHHEQKLKRRAMPWTTITPFVA